MAVPTVITNAVTVVDHSNIILNGNLSSDGGSPIIEMGFCWNTTGNPTTSDTYCTVLITAGAFSAEQDVMSIPEGFYYMRAFATNGDGTSYGSQTTFSLSEEPTQVQLVCEFSDINENSFKIQIYRPNHPADPEYQIPTKCSAGVFRNHGGSGKNGFESTVIQGQELVYKFHMPSEYVSYIDYLLESQYKDYTVILWDMNDTPVEIFRGYLKPENLTKRYETWPPYVEIELSASDSLVELDYMEFKDSSEELIVNSAITILEVIKKCLEKISDPGGLGLDFKIQLGTYETTLMSSDECALAKVTVNTMAFVEGELEEKKAISCFQVIERLLKPFNVFFRQEKGYYHICNPHELDSKEFIFDWLTLTEQSREDTTNVKDISDDNFLLNARLIEQQKIHPLKYGYVTHRNIAIAEELVSSDWNDWTVSDWSSSGVDPANNDLVLSYLLLNKDTDPKPSITSAWFPVIKYFDADRFLFRFTFELTSILKPGGAGVLKWKVEIKHEDDPDWRDPSYWDVWAKNQGYAVEVMIDPSLSDSYRVTESGNYQIRLSLHVEGGSDTAYYQVHFRLRNPSMKVYSFIGLSQALSSFKEPEEEITETGPVRRGGTTVLRAPASSSGRRIASRSSSGSASGRRSSGRVSDPGKDRTFKLEQPNGYETFESDLHFADGVTTEEIIESGTLKISDTLTSGWCRYGASEELSLLNLYIANVIDNRQKYKNYLRCVIIDRDHKIDFNNILTIESKNYFILDYFRDYVNGQLEVALVELITDKLTYEEDIELVNKSSMLMIASPNPALFEEGEYMPAHGFKVGDILRYSMNPGYTKAQADTAEHARAVSVVSDVLTDDIFKHISDGYIRSDAALYKALDALYNLTNHKGEYYFLSPTKAGEICRADELDEEDIEQCVGFVTTKGFKIEIDAKNLPSWRGVSDVFVEPHEIYPIDYLYQTKRGVDYYITDIPKMNGIFAGGIVTWLGDMNFAVSPAVYYINGKMYFYEGGIVTLNSGVSGESDSRIDIIVVNTDEEAVGIEGTPAPNPMRPSADPAYQIELTHVLISGGSAPGGGGVETSILSEVIYNENVEWYPSNNSGLSIDFDSTTAPYLGSKCADVSDIIDGDEIEFLEDTSGVIHSKDDYNNLSLFLKLKEEMTSEHLLFAQFLLNDEIVSDEVQLPINKGNISSWQNVSIGLTSFTFSGDEFNQVKFRWSKQGADVSHSGFYMDYVKLEGGLSLPEMLWQDGYVVNVEFAEESRTLTLKRNNNLEDLTVVIPGSSGETGESGESTYTYVAYASDNLGSDFSLTPSDTLQYRAEIHVSEELDPPTESDFIGATWVKYIGDDGENGQDADDSFDVYIDFVDADELEFVYNCPAALKFTQQISEGSAATLNPVLNTSMAQFDKLTVTAAEVGLIILKGELL